MSTSRVRHNLSVESENGINKQINMELNASYVYLSMAYYFDRDDVALKNIKKYFLKASEEEREHAMKLMDYLNMRGGRIILTDIQKPEKNEWGSIKDAFEAALGLEHTVNKSLLALHKTANDCNDPQMCDFLETHYLEEQVKAIKELSDYLTNLARVGTGLGEFIFDKELDD